MTVMKKYILFFLLTVSFGLSCAQQCTLDTIPNCVGARHEQMYLVYCREYPTDTVRFGDSRYNFLRPYGLSDYLGGWRYRPFIGLSSIDVREGDSIYGVAMAGYFSTKDMDSLRVVMGAMARVGGQFVVLDTADFSNYYQVKVFEHHETGSDGKPLYFYPYLYEFYFDQPVSIVGLDTHYVGVYRVKEKRPTTPSRPETVQPFGVVQGWDTTGLYNGTRFWIYDVWDSVWRYAPSAAGWIGYMAIIAPDEVRCPQPAAPWLAAVEGNNATLQWEPCLCDSVQLEVTPFDSLGNPAARTRTYTTQDDSLYTLHDLDITRRYAARLRVRCHHLCPSHDTLLWSPWSDTVFFSLPRDTVGILSPHAAGFTLQPNPATGSVTLTLAESSLPADVEVVDMAGRTVLARRATSPTLTLSLDGLPAGTYLVRAAGHTRRLVKN